MKYGDIENVTKDVKTIKDILARQGTSLLIDVIAEKIGEMNLKFNLQESDITKLKESLTIELRDAINERT